MIIHYHGNRDMEYNEIFTNTKMCERNSVYVKIGQKIYAKVLSKVVI